METMVDAREKAPGAATRDMYLDPSGNPIAHASRRDRWRPPFPASPRRSTTWRADSANCP